MRRLLIALTLSLAVHAVTVAGGIAYGLWRTMSLVPSVKVETVAIDLTRDLPLGAPAPKAAPAPDKPRVRPRKPKPRVTSSSSQVAIAVARDAGAHPEERDAGAMADLLPRDGGGSVDGGGGIDGGRRRPGDLRGLGPDGSRLVALLRLDRVRASPGHERTIPAVDQLLLLLPDRHFLLEGSGLDLFRDFDSLLIATPNPRDAAVTFLVVRHHLTERALKAGLERAAKAVHKPITWHTVDGRPVGIRQRAAASPNSFPLLDRDDRIIALPHASLAIMATPAYATQLLGRDVLTSQGLAKPVDAGPSDAGRDDGWSPAKSPAGVRWSDVVARIDAEERAMPDDAVFMMTATNLLVPTDSPGLVVPATRGANEDFPARPLPSVTSAVPQTITLMAGLESPFIALDASFDSALAADQWERDLPRWKRKFMFNPVVLLAGISPLLQRSQSTREGDALSLRADSSTEEIERLLNLATNLARVALGRPR